MGIRAPASAWCSAHRRLTCRRRVAVFRYALAAPGLYTLDIVVEESSPRLTASSSIGLRSGSRPGGSGGGRARVAGFPRVVAVVDKACLAFHLTRRCSTSAKLASGFCVVRPLPSTCSSDGQGRRPHLLEPFANRWPAAVATRRSRVALLVKFGRLTRGCRRFRLCEEILEQHHGCLTGLCGSQRAMSNCRYSSSRLR